MSVCTGCCATLDYVVSYIFKNLMKHKMSGAGNSEENSQILRILDLHPEVLQQVSASSLQMVVSVSNRNCVLPCTDAVYNNEHHNV